MPTKTQSVFISSDLARSKKRTLHDSIPVLATPETGQSGLNLSQVANEDEVNTVLTVSIILLCLFNIT